MFARWFLTCPTAVWPGPDQHCALVDLLTDFSNENTDKMTTKLADDVQIWGEKTYTVKLMLKLYDVME